MYENYSMCSLNQFTRKELTEYIENTYEVTIMTDDDVANDKELTLDMALDSGDYMLTEDLEEHATDAGYIPLWDLEKQGYVRETYLGPTESFMVG